MKITLSTKLIGLFLLFCTFSSFSQSSNNNWYFGDGNVLDFSAGDPVISERGIEIATPTETFCREGTSVISDDTGVLLFYTDGIKVWDRLDNEMPNGFGLLGTSSSAQVLIVPNPDDTNIYYIFHMDFAAADPNAGLRYTEVDMTLNGGFGDVTVSKNILLINEAVAEQLKPITHCNGNDIWVLSHMATGDEYNAFLITGTGVDTDPVSTNIGTSYETPFTGMSYMTCTPDGSKVAVCIGNGAPVANVITFNNLTGQLCDPEVIDIPDFVAGGIEFSADATKLYVSGFNLHQYDFGTSSWYTYPGVDEPGALMRGPNDKIYIAGGCDWYSVAEDLLYTARFIHAINAPNELEAASLLELEVFVTPRECGLGLGTYYVPTQTVNTCDPLTAEFTVDNMDLCVDDCVIYENLSTGTAISTIEWTFEGGAPSTFIGSEPPVICYSTEGVFTTTLVITDCVGETDTYELTINVSACEVDFEGDNIVICAGECINFSDLSAVEDIVDWAWEFPGAVTATSAVENPTSICYDLPGTYDVKLAVTDATGAEFERLKLDYILVEVCEPPIAVFSLPDTVCIGTCLDFADESLNSPDTWFWTFENAVTTTSTDQNPLDICFEMAGVQSISLSCSNDYGTDEVVYDIVIIEPPYAGADVLETYCDEIPEIELFELLIGESGEYGNWYNGDTDGSIPAPFLTSSDILSYYYTLSKTYNGQACVDTSFIEITLIESPEISLDDDMEWCSNTQVILVPDVQDGLELVWQDGSTNSLFTYEPSLTDIGNSTLFSVSVTNECGTSTDEIEVTFIDCEIYVFVPNAFTPDGNSVNNEFTTFVAANQISNYQFSVYNRWGQLVFNTTNPTDYWNGAVNGSLVQDGVFIWDMKFNYISNGKKQFSNNGHIVLLK